MAAVTRSTCPYDEKYGNVKVDISSKDDSLSIVVETLRLRILSVTTEEYLLDLTDLYGSETVNRLVGTGTTLDAASVKAKIQRWIKRWSDKNPLSGYVIVEKDSGEFVGQIILKRVKDKSDKRVKFVAGVVEVGYLSAKKHWGKKYGQEFTHAVVYHLLPKLKEAGHSVEGRPFTLVMATARVDNVASNRILSKFLVHDGTKPRYGSPREWYHYDFPDSNK